MSRIVLNGPATYYISPTGSDTTGDGSAANPWQTRAFAFATLQRTLDLAGYVLTVKMLPGVYSDEMPDGGLSGPFVGQANVTSVVFDGTDPSGPAVISTKSHCWLLQNGAALTVRGQYLISTNGVGLFATGPGTQIFQLDSMTFQICGGGHIFVSYWATWAALHDYSIVGDAPYHFYSSVFGGIGPGNGINVTVNVPRKFSEAFAVATDQGNIIAPNMKFNLNGAGSVSGMRAIVNNWSIIRVGGDPNYFPGDRPPDINSATGLYV